MNRLLAISFLAVLVSLNACGGGTAPAPSLNDVAQESDTGTEFTPCTKHSECTPHYCVNGYCNGTPEPKDDVSNTDQSQPDVASSDNGTDVTADTEPDAGTEPDVTPPCTSNEDCNDGDACTKDQCQWGTCYHSAETCGEGQACYTSTSGQKACAYVCEQDNDCAPANECYTATCQNGFCQFATADGQECNDGNACTVNDTCLAGNCHGEAKDCPHGCNPGNGACMPACQTDVNCQDNDPCTVDTCEGMTCQHNDLCLYYDSEVIARQCETDADCSSSEFGTYCIESGEPGHSLKLCQPCYVGNDENYGCAQGELCFWGVLNDDAEPVNYFSTYWCEVVPLAGCDTDDDCDDGIPCTIDVCGAGIDCSHFYRPYCTECEIDSDCTSQHWCDNETGGVYIQYAHCEQDNSCQVDYWADTVDLAAYGCHVPIPCEQDSDCPGTGECMISNCWYADGNWPECYLIDNGNGSATGEFCPAGQACVDNHCQPIVITTCQTDSDCVAAGLGSYCAADLETGEYGCYTCKWDDNTQQVSPGCSESEPYCMWDNTTNTFGCQTCYSDAQCGNWQHCESGSCQGYGPVYCTFECPDPCAAEDLEGLECNKPDWAKAVIWYGNNESVERECGTSWTISQSTLCLWGTGNPVFKFNLTDGVWAWGDGVNTDLVCNYPVTITPDPTWSGTPDVTMGDLGVAIGSFDNLSCE